MMACYQPGDRCPSEPVTAVPSSLPSRLGPLPLTVPRVARLSEGHLSPEQHPAAPCSTQSCSKPSCPAASPCPAPSCPVRPDIPFILQRRVFASAFLRRYLHSFRAMLAGVLLVAASCSRPGSYEEFVKAADAVDGVYEFVLPNSVMPGSTGHPATFDLSFYTAPLDEPLQLDITWNVVAANTLTANKLTDSIPTENEGNKSAQDSNNQSVVCHREIVWFPAGRHKALYRSGMSFDTSALCGPSPIQDVSGESASVLPPTFPNSGQKQGRSQASGQDLPQYEAFLGKVAGLNERGKSQGQQIRLQVRPVNPPEDFRGLGIICKRNDGTR